MAIHSLLSTGFDSNIFLVTGSRPLLIDTGTGDNEARLHYWMQALLKEKKLDRIVLTHRHIDHVGGVAGVKKDHDVPVLIHRDDSEAVRNADPEETGAVIFGISLCPMDVQELKGGEIISSGDHDLQVIHTPGHSAGSICLFERETGSLICGDTIFENGVGRWDLPSGNREALLRSVRSLRQLKVRNIYPGHGPCALGNGEEAIERALAYLGEY